MLKLHSYICDKAVFQQNKPIFITGIGKKNRKIVAMLIGDENLTAEGLCDESGHFYLTLPQAKASYTPHTLEVICGSEKAIFRDILIGDVYLAAGQSNMAYPVSAAYNGNEILEKATKADNVRFLYVPDGLYLDGRLVRPSVPQADLATGSKFYSFTDLEQLKSVSAVAVMFALGIFEKEGIPIAIIPIGVGGSSIDSWIPRAEIDDETQLSDYMKENGLYYFSEDELPNKVRSYTLAAGLFNEKVSPLKGFSIRAVLWYQGESSAWNFETAIYYAEAYKALINSYRKIFGDKLPFLTSHIAPLYYPNGGMGVCYINEALTKVGLGDDNVFIAPIYDIEPRFNNNDGQTYYTPIHPTNKQPVADRLIYLAGNLYSKMPKEFPYICNIERYEDYVLVQTSAATITSKNLFGFTISDICGNYYQAKAKIVAKNKIMVYNKYVKNPQNLCYAFFPLNGECDFKSENGLSLMPYRSSYCSANDMFIPKPFLSCNIESIFSNDFDTLYGKNCRESVYTIGNINGTQNATIHFTNINSEPTVRLTYFPQADSMFLCGLSPRADFAGFPLQLYKFTYLRFKIYSSNDCSFFGLFFCSSNGNSYRFCAEVNGVLEPRVNILKGENELILNLKTALKCDECRVTVTKELTEAIYKLQFTFQDKQAGKLDFYNFELY